MKNIKYNKTIEQIIELQIEIMYLKDEINHLQFEEEIQYYQSSINESLESIYSYYNELIKTGYTSENIDEDVVNKLIEMGYTQEDIDKDAVLYKKNLL